jgi:protein-S-isoprenylcysteine O-methyltransferase Ste14
MGKPRGPNMLHDVQTRRRGLLAAVAAGFVALFALTAGADVGGWSNGLVRYLGLVAVAVCVVGRCWCTLYIGGRKAKTLVDAGPYSTCRNPLYFFSLIGTFGFGAATGSLIVALMCTVIVWAVFRGLVAKEEAFLKTALGEPYEQYLRTTPRFVPNPALWRGVEVLQVEPRLVVRTFYDGLMFFLGIPLALIAASLQAAGVLPALIALP